jgi:hypothetical protein
MQNDVANAENNARSQHHHGHEQGGMNAVQCSGLDTIYNSPHDAMSQSAYGDVRVHRTVSFWSFLLIPMAVILGWTQYTSLSAAPWMEMTDLQNPGHWNEAMRYYIWLQLVWVPANMVIFLVWCALGVRIWNCKRKLPAP